MARIVDRLEPEAIRMWDTSPLARTDAQSAIDIQALSAVSIAISLKRIADAMLAEREKPLKTEN